MSWYNTTIVSFLFLSFFHILFSSFFFFRTSDDRGRRVDTKCNTTGHMILIHDLTIVRNYLLSSDFIELSNIHITTNSMQKWQIYENRSRLTVIFNAVIVNTRARFYNRWKTVKCKITLFCMDRYYERTTTIRKWCKNDKKRK